MSTNVLFFIILSESNSAYSVVPEDSVTVKCCVLSIICELSAPVSFLLHPPRIKRLMRTKQISALVIYFFPPIMTP